jgi:pyruvate/2-oxoglutarate dehydrogenase complex dihydrolipoamide acyltransferase (E2) component
MANVELVGRAALTPWRHMALGTWRTARDPSIYGSVSLRMDAALDYIRRFREATGRHLTVTHLMAKVVGSVLAELPEINAISRWKGIYLRKAITVFFQVAIEDPKTGDIDLSGIKITEPQTKPLLEIIDEFESKVARVRERQDHELERSRGMLHRIPAVFVGLALRVLGFLSYALNLDLRWAGVPKDPFGSVMVTNIGSLGLEAAYVPLVPFSRVPVLVAMGEVEDAPVVEGGSVVAKKVMRLFATFDHRVVDGVHAAKMVRIVRTWLEHPFEHFDRVT